MLGNLSRGERDRGVLTPRRTAEPLDELTPRLSMDLTLGDVYAQLATTESARTVLAGESKGSSAL
jgi:hypothetical protein